MNFWEELGEAGIGKRDLSPRCGKNVTGQVKTAYFFFFSLFFNLCTKEKYSSESAQCWLWLGRAGEAAARITAVGCASLQPGDLTEELKKKK